MLGLLKGYSLRELVLGFLEIALDCNLAEAHLSILAVLARVVMPSNLPSYDSQMFH